jgi:hypothetical protein
MNFVIVLLRTVSDFIHPHSAFLYGITDVVLLGAQPKMIRADTGTDVTAVQHLKSSGDRAEG